MTSKQITAAPSLDITFKKQSQFKETWRRFRKNRGAMIGLVLLIILLVVIIFADLIVPYERATTQDLSMKLEGPSSEHIFGTDQYGRDLFARVVHGGRTSLGIALLATITSCVVGSALGAIAGYFGGKIDSIIMRGLDIFMSVPDILFTMAVVYALGASFTNLSGVFYQLCKTGKITDIEFVRDGLRGSSKSRWFEQFQDNIIAYRSQRYGCNYSKYDLERGKDNIIRIDPELSWLGNAASIA